MVPENTHNISRSPQRTGINIILITAVCSLAVAMMVAACESNKNTKVMTEQNATRQPADTFRLLTIANLEKTDSNRKAVAWFFETPQVFEIEWGTPPGEMMLQLLEEARKNQQPVNVRYNSTGEKNMIESVMPATAIQLKNHNEEKAKRETPSVVPKPENK
jgi:hypothetical protein